MILRVGGEYAHFANPVISGATYPIITPPAARGILESIYWKPEMAYRIHKIFVEKPIKFLPNGLMTNGVKNKISLGKSAKSLKLAPYNFERTQLIVSLLHDVCYSIEFSVGLSDWGVQAGSDPAKHRAIIADRASKGKRFHQPFLGRKEFVADKFDLIDTPAPNAFVNGELGTMVYDYTYEDGVPSAHYFNCSVNSGVVDLDSVEVM